MSASSTFSKIVKTPPPLHSFAHLIIDVQRFFTDPLYEYARKATGHTELTARKIAKTSKNLRSYGVTTAIIYAQETNNRKLDHTGAFGGLHHVIAAPEDILLPKKHNSAFSNADLDETLKQRGAEYLLISGFNTSACVKETVLDALDKGYKPIVMVDCTADEGTRHAEKEAFTLMGQLGAVFTHSNRALDLFKAPQIHEWPEP